VKAYAGLEKEGEIYCSRCFDRLGEICRYGVDERGFWFVAPCRRCGAWMKWYRDRDGKTSVEEEDAGFVVAFENGEAVLRFSIDEG